MIKITKPLQKKVGLVKAPSFFYMDLHGLSLDFHGVPCVYVIQFLFAVLIGWLNR